LTVFIPGSAKVQAVNRGSLSAVAQVLIPGQWMWDLFWTKWHWKEPSFHRFGFSSQYHSSNAPYSFGHPSPMLRSITKCQCR
jgi:hypothetical protein